MRLYWITGLPFDKRTSVYVGSLAEAAETARNAGRSAWPNIMVDLREIEADKETLLRILNREGAYQGPALRSWTVSPRGALVEVTPDKE